MEIIDNLNKLINSQKNQTTLNENNENININNDLKQREESSVKR